jgi:hypothetical protein
MERLLAPTFSYLASTRAAEFFLIRDLSDIPHVAWFEYLNAKNEAVKRFKSKKRKASKAQ